MSHIHMMQRTQRTLDFAPSAAARAITGRCHLDHGDPTNIIDRCRCGATRHTPATMVAPSGAAAGAPLGVDDAVATEWARGGAWVGGQP